MAGKRSGTSWLVSDTAKVARRDSVTLLFEEAVGYLSYGEAIDAIGDISKIVAVLIRYITAIPGGRRQYINEELAVLFRNVWKIDESSPITFDFREYSSNIGLEELYAHIYRRGMWNVTEMFSYNGWCDDNMLAILDGQYRLDLTKKLRPGDRLSVIFYNELWITPEELIKSEMGQNPANLMIARLTSLGGWLGGLAYGNMISANVIQLLLERVYKRQPMRPLLGVGGIDPSLLTEQVRFSIMLLTMQIYRILQVHNRVGLQALLFKDDVLSAFGRCPNIFAALERGQHAYNQNPGLMVQQLGNHNITVPFLPAGMVPWNLIFMNHVYTFYIEEMRRRSRGG